MPKERRYRKLEDTPIYIDVSKLLETVYGLSFSMQKKDRAVMSVRLLDNVSQMFSELALAYRLKHERVRHIDRFLSAFEVFKGFFRVCCNLKIVKPGNMTSVYILVQRIDDGIMKWRSTAVSKVQQPRVSNYDPEPGLHESRGGDGIIYTSSGSAS